MHIRDAMRRGRRLALASAVLLLAAAAPAAADYYDAVVAYDRGDFAAARTGLEPLAASGDPRAQLLLGRMHAAGQGVLQDYVRAHALFNLAAAAGIDGAAAARDEVAGRMTAEQIAEAQQEARDLAALRDATPAAGDAPAADAGVGADRGTDRIPLARAEFVDLQWQLAVHGYDPGPADGTAGPRTEAAIRRYQADAGLAVDGRPSRALLDHLQFTVPAVRNATAPAPASAPHATALRGGPPGPLDDLDPGLRRIYVVGIQDALAARGYDPGPADGVAGTRTRAAIRRYQADAGLPVDGQPSPALLNHLKFVGGQVAVGS